MTAYLKILRLSLDICIKTVLRKCIVKANDGHVFTLICHETLPEIKKNYVRSWIEIKDPTLHSYYA